MSGYTYEAYDRSGKKISGKIHASDRQAAIQELRSTVHLYRLQEIKPSIWKREFDLGPKKIPLKHFVPFLRQLATLIKAGVPLVESLRILGEQTACKPLKKMLPECAAGVARGNQFSEVLREYDHLLPTVFAGMIRAGEITGNLEEVLEHLADAMEKEHKTREKIKSAMTYPILLGITSVIVTVILLVKIIPTFVVTLTSMGVPLPLPTRIVIGLSDHLIGTWYFYLLGVLLFTVAARYLAKKPRGRYRIDRLKLRLPVFGHLFRKAAIARAARTMASLFASGVPALQALTIAANVVGNEVYARALRQSREALRVGQSMTAPLRKETMFPPLVTQMITIGEQTGNLDAMFGKIADFYEADVEATVDKLRPMIEPLMILVLSIVVGVIVTAAIAPIFSIYSNSGMN